MFIKGIPPQGSLTAAECFSDHISPRVWDMLCFIWFCDNHAFDHMQRCIKNVALTFPNYAKLQAFEVKSSEAYFASFRAAEMRRFLDEIFFFLFLESVFSYFWWGSKCPGAWFFRQDQQHFCNKSMWAWVYRPCESDSPSLSLLVF